MVDCHVVKVRYWLKNIHHPSPPTCPLTLFSSLHRDPSPTHPPQSFIDEQTTWHLRCLFDSFDFNFDAKKEGRRSTRLTEDRPPAFNRYVSVIWRSPILRGSHRQAVMSTNSQTFALPPQDWTHPHHPRGGRSSRRSSPCLRLHVNFILIWYFVSR
jgi:hypothetical protein